MSGLKLIGIFKSDFDFSQLRYGVNLRGQFEIFVKFLLVGSGR